MPGNDIHDARKIDRMQDQHGDAGTFPPPEMGVLIAGNDALAGGTRTFHRFHDHETLPAVTGTNHKNSLPPEAPAAEPAGCCLSLPKYMLGVVTTIPILSLTEIQFRASTPAGRTPLEAPTAK
jgi:hypothetical protein